MKGKDIAKNLRGSCRKWGRGRLFAAGQYCVLGIKAAEAGVADETLQKLDYQPIYCFARDIYFLNDKCNSKQELIAKLESPANANRRFPIERFVRMALKFQRELEKAAQ